MDYSVIEDENAARATIEKHRTDVMNNMNVFVEKLIFRAQDHDMSKFSDEEFPALFEIMRVVNRQGKADFGTPEYERRKAMLEPMTKHHYADPNNTHHPEHFENGLDGMDLLDIIEMFCDWKAAGEERNLDGKMSLNKAMERYNMSRQLRNIFLNTAKNLGIDHT